MVTATPETVAGPGATPAERAAAGKAARARVPRSSHADWAPAADRPDPVDVLEGQAADRLPELVPLRYSRMLASPFTFYRGAAAIMAADLAASPSSGLWVQACGDAHLSNFGAFASPSRDLVADVNDFDETLPGPWEWDLKRLAASFEIAGRDRGFDASTRRKIVRRWQRSYREAMRRFAALTNLDLWYLQVEIDQIRERFEGDVSRKELKQLDRNIAKARRKTRMRAFDKLTTRVDGELRIIHDPPVVVPLEELFAGKAARDRRRAAPQVDRGVPRHPRSGAPTSARYLPLRARGPQGRRRGQRRHPRLDRAVRRARRGRPAVPSGQGGATIGARAVHGAERVSRTRASGSSRASG